MKGLHVHFDYTVVADKDELEINYIEIVFLPPVVVGDELPSSIEVFTSESEVKSLISPIRYTFSEGEKGLEGREDTIIVGDSERLQIIVPIPPYAHTKFLEKLLRSKEFNDEIVNWVLPYIEYYTKGKQGYIYVGTSGGSVQLPAGTKISITLIPSIQVVDTKEYSSQFLRYFVNYDIIIDGKFFVDFSPLRKLKSKEPQRDVLTHITSSSRFPFLAVKRNTMELKLEEKITSLIYDILRIKPPPSTSWGGTTRNPRPHRVVESLTIRKEDLTPAGITTVDPITNIIEKHIRDVVKKLKVRTGRNFYLSLSSEEKGEIFTYLRGLIYLGLGESLINAMGDFYPAILDYLRSPDVSIKIVEVTVVKL